MLKQLSWMWVVNWSNFAFSQVDGLFLKCIKAELQMSGHKDRSLIAVGTSLKNMIAKLTSKMERCLGDERVTELDTTTPHLGHHTATFLAGLTSVDAAWTAASLAR